MGLDVRWCIVVRLVLLLALAHIHVRGRHVGLAVLIGLVLWSTVHAREVRCATNRWRHGPGRRDAFPFRIPREQSVPPSFFAPCCTHCTAETRPTLAGLCLAWPVSELRRNGFSATTEQRQPCQYMHAGILDSSKFFVLASGASRVTINAILSCIGADPKSNSKSIMNSR